MDQLALVLSPAAARESRIDRAFAEFHRSNPHVYQRLAEMARQLVARGHKRIGIGMLFEVLRWQSAIETTGDEFRLNNNYRSRYARLLMDREPDLAGVFELRELAEEG